MKRVFAILFLASLVLAACGGSSAPASAQDLPTPKSGLERMTPITGDGIEIRTGGFIYTLNLKSNSIIEWSKFDTVTGKWSDWTEVSIQEGDFLLLPKGTQEIDSLPPSGSFLVYVQGPRCIIKNPVDGSCMTETSYFVYDVSWIP